MLFCGFIRMMAPHWRKEYCPYYIQHFLSLRQKLEIFDTSLVRGRQGVGPSGQMETRFGAQYLHELRLTLSHFDDYAVIVLAVDY